MPRSRPASSGDESAASDGTKPRVTLRDIGAALGVAAMTVSRALRNQAQVSTELRERIQAKARELGYVPDPMLAALAHYRQDRAAKPVHAGMAWLNAWQKPERLRLFREFDLYWRGALVAAEKFGYHLEEFVVNNDMPLRRLRKVLLARNVRGILVPPGPDLDWSQLGCEDFSIVRLGRSDQNTGMHFVTSAQVDNAMLAFDKIREKGYERVGYVGYPGRRTTFGAGFLWAQTELPESLRLPPFLTWYFERPEMQRLLMHWLKEQKPDAIFTPIPELPAILERAGYRVPEDIGLATTSVLDCPISAGVDQNAWEIGRVAILVLISLINDNARGFPPVQREILVKGRWIDGMSLPLRVDAP